MTTPEQARQLMERLRMGASIAKERDLYSGYVLVALASADCIESLLEQIEQADVSAYREAMNADVGIDYKSPGNDR